MRSDDNENPENQVVQNRFTAYLKVSINHHRTQYMQRLCRQQRQEVPIDDPDAFPVDAEFAVPDTQLRTALSRLRGQAQTILLEHILGDKSLVQLARELDMPYPTVKAIYSRALEKLRKELLYDEFY